MARSSLYRTYRFIDKDPIVDALRTVIQDEHLKPSDVHAVSGVATQTIDNWLNGETMRPQNVTACAVTSALGYVRRDELRADGTVAIGFKKARTIDPKVEREKQADWLLKHPREKRKTKTNGHAKK